MPSIRGKWTPRPLPLPSPIVRPPFSARLCNLRRVSLSEVFSFRFSAESASENGNVIYALPRGGGWKQRGARGKGDLGFSARTENCHLPLSLVVITVIIVYTHAFSEWYIVSYSWGSYRVSAIIYVGYSFINKIFTPLAFKMFVFYKGINGNVYLKI